MKTLIEIHVLQNFAPSNLNRDDTGAPKDAFFGGTRRARVSSQCFKRAVRDYFKEKIKHPPAEQGDKGLPLEYLGKRSKRLLDKIVEQLAAAGRNAEEAKRRARLAMLGGASIWIAPNGEEAEEDEKSEYLLFLGAGELTALAAAVNQRWDLEAWEKIEEASKKSSVKEKKKEASKKASKELKEVFYKALDGGKAVDVALFGRMLADMPEKNQNAACQVAHAISTHAVEREFDFYTAVDDLKPEDTAGADMMGTVEFNSACFYRYAVVDWEKLKSNLQGDEELPRKGLRAFLEGFVVATPTGKQNTFAAHNPPEFVAVSVRRDAAPRSLANAFETAIRVKRDESLTRKSAEALVQKAKVLEAAYGGEGQTFVLNLIGADHNGFGTAATSLEELVSESLSAVGG
ncbi:MAG: type I-E CRISPR-associated protein Cas7/Cse4/CasC [Deferrisomatales bacterium]